MRQAYDLFVGAEWVTPSEFWALTVKEVWWIYEAKTPEEQRQKASGEYWHEMYEVLKSEPK